MLHIYWTEVACYVKHVKGPAPKKIRDRFRIYVNAQGCVKGKSERNGKEYNFKSLEDLHSKVKSLKKISYKLETGALPTTVTCL